MARNTNPMRGTRNTAPMWKKVSVVLAAPVAMFLVIRLLHTNEWNFFLFAVVTVGAGVLGVWLVARLLGVRLGLGSWDEVQR